MTLALGCIADDYTGASDLANTLTRAGLRTVQTIGVPADDLALPEVDAVVVSLKSRSIEAGLAVSRSRAAEKWLRGRGAGHVLFKICSTFDSTDAGNIGPVMDALRADCGEAIVLVTPAFPETGRTVYQGNLFVGAVPLNESPLKDHPLNPMHDSNLVRVLARQSKTQVGLVDLATVRAARRPCGRGSPNSQARASAPRSSTPCSTAISRPSASSRRASAVGRRLRHRARAGAGAGLDRQGQIGRGSGAAAGRRSADRRHASPEAARRRRCSRSPMPNDHAGAASRSGPYCYGSGRSAARDGLGGRRFSAGPVLIASARHRIRSPPCNRVTAAMQPDTPSSRRWPTLRKTWCESGVRRLVVAGGETSGAVVDRLGIPGFLVGAEIAAGVPVLRAVGAEEATCCSR